MFSLEVQNLSACYGKDLVVSDVSFSLSQGEMLAVIGPNGSGKSTLLKAILGFKTPTAGSVLINGLPPQKAIKQFKGDIAYLPQQHQINNLLPLTAYDIVAQGFKARKSWGQSLNPEEKDKILHALEKVQLVDFKEELFSHLSGGQRQRILLALALANQPKLLFLDEPTNALDYASIESIYQILDKLRSQQVGILIISHDISTIVSTSDKIAVLMQKMHYYGIPSQLPEDIIHHVFGSHIKIIPNDPNCKECSLDHHS